MHLTLQYDEEEILNFNSIYFNMYTDKAYIIYDSFCGKFYVKFGYFHPTQQEASSVQISCDVSPTSACQAMVHGGTSEVGQAYMNEKRNSARPPGVLQKLVAHVFDVAMAEFLLSL